MSTYRTHLLRGLCPVAVAMASMPGLAVAQTSPSPPAGEAEAAAPGEIIVTAQRRSESIQSVPLAVTSVSGTDLQRSGISNATDIAVKVPGLRFVELGGAVINYNLRGVSQNDFTDHLEPPIALYVDDSYLSTPTQAGLPVFDMQRVEVLRGPQGTLFGRNATGGLIQFISNQPSDHLEGYVNLTVADNFWGKAEGAISGPLSPGVNARLAAAVSTRDGYVKNNGPDGGKLGGENYAAVRGILAIEPSEGLKININARYYKNFNQHGAPYSFDPTIPTAEGLGRKVGPNENPYGTCTGCGSPLYGDYKQPDPYSGVYSTLGRFQREAVGATLKIEKDFGGAQLSSITDYQHLTKSYFEDVDATPFNYITDEHNQRLDQFTQELRLAGSGKGLTWSTGAYFYYQKSQTLNAYDVFAGLLTPHGTAAIKSKSYAIYGQVDYEFVPTLSVTLGGRYTKDKKTLDYYLADPGASVPPFAFNTTTYPDLARKSDDLYSARASLQWKPNSRTMLYASFNRGTKGGSFGLPYFLPVDPSQFAFKPERLNSYEIGEKWTSPDGVLKLNLTAFYYDYKNYQAFFYQTLNGFPVGQIRNLDATAKGIEGELAVRPVTGLTFGLNATVMDSTVKKVGLPNGTVVERPLPQAPKFSGTATVRYEMPVSSTLNAAIDANVSWNSSQHLTVLAAQDEREGAYQIGDLRLSLADSAGKWEFAVFAKNLWNTRYRIFAYDLSNPFGTIAQVYNRPRTVGASFKVTY